MKTKKNNKFFVLIFLVISIMLITSGCGNKGDSGQDSSRLDTVKSNGNFKVAISSADPPYSYVDEDGELVGFDIDLANLINEATFGEDSEAEFEEISLESRWSAVKNGQVDFGMMGTTIYPERLANVAFTRALFETGKVILTKKDVGIESIEDLNDPNITVGLLTIPSDQDKQKELFPESEVQTYKEEPTLITSLITDKVDALLIDLPPAQKAIGDDDKEELTIIQEKVGNSADMAIFLTPGDFEYWRYLDSVVEELRNGSLKEEFDEIFVKWFGETPDNFKDILE